MPAAGIALLNLALLVPVADGRIGAAGLFGAYWFESGVLVWLTWWQLRTATLAPSPGSSSVSRHIAAVLLLASLTLPVSGLLALALISGTGSAPLGPVLAVLGWIVAGHVVGVLVEWFWRGERHVVPPDQLVAPIAARLVVMMVAGVVGVTATAVLGPGPTGRLTLAVLLVLMKTAFELASYLWTPLVRDRLLTSLVAVIDLGLSRLRPGPRSPARAPLPDPGVKPLPRGHPAPTAHRPGDTIPPCPPPPPT